MSWTIAPIGRGSDLLYSQAGMPSLDLRFAESKTLVDYISNRNLITFSRASGGTYVDSQGVIRNATTNLLLRSEEFDNASWAKTASSATANVAVAPNGSLTADKLVDSATNSVHYVSQTFSAVSGISYTISCYFKQGEIRHASLNFSSAVFGFNDFGVFDLLAGVVSDAGSSATASIESVGDGWYRCRVTVTASGTGTALAVLSVRGDGGTGRGAAYIGDGTSGIYIWGAQLEQSSTVGEYIPTTSTINSAPRFDHDPETGESLGLLVEEARTNLLVRSEEFDSASWVKLGSVVSADAIASPSGAITTDLLREDAFTSIHEIYIANTGGAATYTLSVFFKNGSGTRHLNLGASRGASGWISCRFNPVNGTASVVSIEGGSFTSASTQVISMGNGWYRGALTFTSSGLFSTQVALSSSSAAPASGTFGVETYQGDGTSGIYIWGAQLEAGAFPTSYIKTEATTATRAADVCSISGSNFSSWYNSTQSTIFLEASTPSSGSPGFFTLENGSVAEYIRGARSFSLSHLLVSNTGGNTADIYSSNALSPNTLFRSSYGIAQNNVALSLNGVTPAVDTVVDMPQPSNILRIGQGKYISASTSTIRRFTYWPARLPNSTLQAITQ